MQRFIFKHKNHITFISGSLVLIGFISELVLKNHLVFEASLITASIIASLPIFIQALQSLKYKLVSIDVLVSIAVLGAFMIQAYEESAIVSFLFLFGAYLEARTLNKTRSAIKSLLDLAPETALRLNEDGSYEEVDVDEIDVNDTVLVKTGAKIPVDGIVLSGEGYADEASITGESKPILKEINAHVFAGTILDNGTIQVQALKVGEDTTFGKIIELVEEAQDSKSQTERFIDRFSKHYTPVVLALALVVYAFTRDIELSITILVLGCPGALVIGVPVSNVAGIGNGASHSVLFKGSETIQSFSQADVCVFDKTGTLTEGKPQVSSIKILDKNRSEIESILVSVENESNHPLAKAIVDHFDKFELCKIEKTEVIKGQGVIAVVNKQKVIIGNLSLIQNEAIIIDESNLEEIKKIEDSGQTLILMSVDNSLKCIIGVKDQVRENVKENIEELRKHGIKRFVLLSGDNQSTVDLIAKECQISEAYGNLLPQDKLDFVKKLQAENHHVVFVGDGINDSPSLTQAEIGIAMGCGTDVAIETSDVVLMNSKFESLVHAYLLSKHTAMNMKQNIFIAIAVVLFLLISVFFSDWMNMSIGMFVHEGSILVVILNGMRLLKFKSKKEAI